MDENEVLNKLENQISLGAGTIRALIWDYKVENIEGEDHRWQREISTIIKIKDRYFQINWMRGLTENQEDDFWEQPFEVYPKTYQKTITVTDWIPKEKE